MRNLFGRDHSPRLPRRRRRSERASVSPNLATIPETSLAVAEDSPFQLDQYYARPQCRQSKRKTPHHHHGSKNAHQIRQSNLQRCLLILAPAHMLFTSLLMIHSSKRLTSLRSHHSHLQFREQSYQTPTHAAGYRVSSSTNLRTGLPKREEHKQSRMSKKRVVVLSYYNDKNVQYSVAEATSTFTVEYFGSMAKENGNANETPHQYESINSTDHSTISNANADCIPMAKWQTMSYPTCNSLHEIDVFASSQTLSHFHHLKKYNNGPSRFQEVQETNVHSLPIPNSYSTKILGNGWFRHAWEVVDSLHDTSVAIKTLR